MHFDDRGPKKRQVPLLCNFEILDYGRHRRNLGAAKGAKGIKRSDRIETTKALFAICAVKGGSSKLRDCSTCVLYCVPEFGIRIVYQDNFPRRQSRKFRSKPDLRAGHDIEGASRNVDPSQRAFIAHHGIRREEVVAPCIKKTVFGQRSWRYQTHNITLHYGLVSTLFGLCGIFQLFANGDTKALADEGEEVAFGRMNGDAAHGDVLVIVLSTLGQSDIKSLCRRDCIFKEHLVEVAHAIKQERTRMIFFDLQILRHHRRNCASAHSVPQFVAPEPKRPMLATKVENEPVARNEPLPYG